VIKTLLPDFYLVTILAVLEKIIIQAFLVNSSEMFQTKFNYSAEGAIYVIMIPSIMFPVVGLWFGYITDKKGQKGYLLISSFFILLISHWIFIGLDECPERENSYSGILPIFLISIANTMI
jgi:MFS family permease